MVVYYDGTFPGAATPAGTVNDTTTVGASGQWGQVSSNWLVDGAGHVVNTVGSLQFYQEMLLQSGGASSVGAKTDVGCTFTLDPFNTTPGWPGALNYGVGLFPACRANEPETNFFGGGTCCPTFQIGINSSNPGGATVQVALSAFNQVSGATTFGSSTTILTGIDPAASYELRYEVTGTAPTVVRFLVINPVSGQILGQHTFTDALSPSNAIPTNSGMVGLSGQTLPNTAPSQSQLLRRIVIDDGTAYVAPPLAAGTLTNTSLASNSVTNQMTIPVGGTLPWSGQMQRSPAGAGTWSNVGSPVAGITGTSSYTDATVAASTSYDYRVVVTDGTSATANSNTVTVTTPGAAVVAGTLTNTTDLFNSVVNHMTAATGGVPPYTGQLQRSPHGAGTYANVGSPVSISGTSSYTDGTVAAATSYDYRVRVTDSASGAANSNVLNIITPAAPSGTKPTNPALDLAHPFAATLKCFIPFSETVAASLPHDIVTNTVLYPYVLNNLVQTALGPDPNPSGYNAGGITGPSAKFVDGGPLVTASVATTASAGPETHALVFRVDHLDAEPPGPTNIQLTRSERPNLVGHGLAIVNTVPSDATPTPVTPATLKIAYGCRAAAGGYLYLPFLSGGNPILLDPTHWYAAAASLSGTTATLFLYDLTAASLVTPPGGLPLVLTGAQVEYRVAGGFFTLNGEPAAPYWGSMAVALCDSEVWTDALFNNFISDPWAAARGPVPVGTGGTLVAGDAGVEPRESGNALNCTHPTGGAAAAPFTYQWVYTEGDPSTPPSTWTLLTGATTREWLDAAATVDVPRWYSCRQTDGTSTAYTTVKTVGGAETFGCRLRGYLRGGWAGTSIVRNGFPTYFAVAANASGYATVNINRGVGATSAAQWADTVNFGWLNALIADILNSGGDTLHVQHGTNDVGAGQIGSAFAANMTSIINVAAGAGLKVVIHDAPWRFDVLATAESVLLNNVAQDALVNGTTVLRGDTVLTTRLSARFQTMTADGLHFQFIDAPGIGCWVSYLRNVLEPSSAARGSFPVVGCDFIRGAP